MKRFILLLILALPFLLMYAQSVFEPAYIITLKNDTTYGFIENNNYTQNSVYCVFKKTESAEPINFSASDIKSYQFVEGKFYSSEKVDEKPMFLEYLVKGKLNLFFNRDIDGNNHFYISNANLPLSELYTTKRVLGKDNIFVNDESQFAFSNVGEKSFQSKKYIGVLRYYTENHPKLINDINNAELSHQSLIKVVSKYNSLFEEAHTESVYVKKFKRNVIVEALGGLYGNRSWSTSLYGLNVLFQQTERSENLYLGLGILYDLLSDNTSFYRIPLSINYLNQKQGFSPTYSYQLDLNQFGMAQMAEVGVKYQFNRFAVRIGVGVNTFYFVKYYAFGTQLGFSYKL